MSSFFNNFMGGLAFGMLASNPLFRVMGGFGYGCGCGYGGVGGFILGGGYNAVNLTGFANPFPSIFGGGYMGGGYASSAGLIMPTGFANNSFPTVDFSGPMQTIWDTYTNPNSDYNKQMFDWFQKMNNQQNPFYNINNKTNNESKTDKNNKKASEVSENSSINSNNSIISYDAKELKNKWASRAKTFNEQCYAKVVEISKKLKCDPNDLMGVMWVESAKTFSPSIKNPHGSATGLIQFTSNTAEALGTSTEELKAMSALEQLDYVEKCLISSKKMAGYKDNETIDRGTLYSLVFLPGRSKRDVLTSKGEDFYANNKVLDYNKDGKITKDDLNSVITDNMA